MTGTDSGIGRAAAIAFARQGADVALSFVEDEMRDAQEVAKLIKAEGRKTVLLPGDITDKAFCETSIRKPVSDLGGLDILVNNASKQTNQKDIGEITGEQFDQTSGIYLTQTSLPVIITTLSIDLGLDAQTSPEVVLLSSHIHHKAWHFQKLH